MNRIVNLWSKHQERPRYNGPDAIKIDDDTTVQFGKDIEMSFDTALDRNQFRSLIRVIKNTDRGKVATIRSITYETLKRVKARRNLSKAVKGVPKGSDQFNEGFIIAWLRNVDPTDIRAVNQVIAVDATAVARMNA